MCSPADKHASLLAVVRWAVAHAGSRGGLPFHHSQDAHGVQRRRWGRVTTWEGSSWFCCVQPTTACPVHPLFLVARLPLLALRTHRLLSPIYPQAGTRTAARCTR